MSSLVRTWCTVPCTNGSAAPSARAGHSCVVCNDHLVVFGGFDGRHRLNDLHAYSFRSERWSVLPASGSVPIPRSRHTSVVYKDSMFVFGGYDGSSRLDDLMEFDFVSQRWRVVQVSAGTAPTPREYHAAVVYGEAMYCFGGSTGVDAMCDVHAFNFETRTWTLVQVTGAVPTPRRSASLVVVEDKGVLFGGRDITGCCLSGVHVFDFAQRAWSLLDTHGPEPIPRERHVAAVHANAMYIFGGSTNGNGLASRPSVLSDFHKLSMAASCVWEMVLSEGESPLHAIHTSHAAAVHGARLLVFGGSSGTAHSNAFTQFRFDAPDGDGQQHAQEEDRGGDGMSDVEEEADESHAVDPLVEELCTCPISMDIMVDPVCTPAGVTYERAMIEQHLDRVGAFDPTTKTPLTRGDLYPNRAVRQLVEMHFPQYARSG